MRRRGGPEHRVRYAELHRAGPHGLDGSSCAVRRPLVKQLRHLARAGGAAPAEVVIADFEYEVPRRVAPGARLSLRNTDGELHSFTSKQARLDVNVPKGRTVVATAPSRPGTYRIVCMFHADMEARLVVR